MPRLVALLRGINVGGHTVKMQELRRLFESLGFAGVETVIASGNVVFESPGDGGPDAERAIERRLAEGLGYQVATFLRTIPELADVVAHQPFDLAAEPEDAVVYVLFLRENPTPALERELRDLATDNDEARAGPRAVYWLRRVRCKEAEVFGVRLGKLLGPETTSRNMNTVRRIAEKYR